ncbi:hypothetical protein FraEuI1c_1293 [Pseudofrankia inefficax]|uniref:Uncharacterized protein n=1 Tax=Pseudofrankia inefficax (strain DSM 45817 / CECT 9037 / DDB 130130 / EuI1c) TaxID=298654 RepID=E3J3M6_PSEI1|nr:hypothetical protein FraEuI1c_1293 [Pseudofrankia inefficax]
MPAAAPQGGVWLCVVTLQPRARSGAATTGLINGFMFTGPLPLRCVRDTQRSKAPLVQTGAPG